MRFLNLFAGAALVASAAAQSTIAFTTLPTSVTANQVTTLAWTGGDNSSVTITLKQGDPNDLHTVQVIADNVSGNTFSWTPSASLPDADDYALSIEQGSEINYTREFSLVGGAAAVTGSNSASASITVASNSSVPTTALTSSSSGVSVSSNATISVPTLSSTTKPSTTPSTTQSGSTTAPTNNSAVKMGSPLALVVGGVAAIMFWG